MSVTLPALPRLAEVRPQYRDFSGVLTPPLGGAVQTIARLGSRYAVAVTLPRLDEDCARAWNAARKKARATADTLILEWPKAAAAGSLGTPLVKGAGQAGTSLICDGFTPGASIAADQYFSVTVSGRSYLYSTTDAATADGSGDATLQIAPMLRAAPADNAPLGFAAPKIEGRIAGSTEDWDIDWMKTYGISFVLEEIE